MAVKYEELAQIPMFENKEVPELNTVKLNGFARNQNLYEKALRLKMLK